MIRSNLQKQIECHQEKKMQRKPKYEIKEKSLKRILQTTTAVSLTAEPGAKVSYTFSFVIDLAEIEDSPKKHYGHSHSGDP